MHRCEEIRRMIQLRITMTTCGEKCFYLCSCDLFVLISNSWWTALPCFLPERERGLKCSVSSTDTIWITLLSTSGFFSVSSEITERERRGLSNIYIHAPSNSKQLHLLASFASNFWEFIVSSSQWHRPCNVPCRIHSIEALPPQTMREPKQPLILYV